ncbi:hypothetical protein [Ornithinimicrobium kibberense]|uniref:hypothetical protein n=1 Tax=Ornithinimicrobium kibberense TaxID=282060 RepID=UPI0036209FF3
MDRCRLVVLPLSGADALRVNERGQEILELAGREFHRRPGQPERLTPEGELEIARCSGLDVLVWAPDPTTRHNGVVDLDLELFCGGLECWDDHGGEVDVGPLRSHLAVGGGEDREQMLHDDRSIYVVATEAAVP